MKSFKPNLIPNFDKGVEKNIDQIILKNGGYDQYFILPKKDGVRVELIDGQVLGRSLKKPGSRLVVERFQSLADLCKELNIILEGEFYWHGQKFNTIMRFFSKSDVTCPKYKAQLRKELSKNPEKFLTEYETTDIDFLTTFHSELRFHIFDGVILDKPELVEFQTRMEEIVVRLSDAGVESNKHFIKWPMFYRAENKENLDTLYRDIVTEGYEGLVLVHRNHEYKYGRNTLKEGTLLKMKDDEFEYDGIILDVVEGTQVKDGVETSTNELGRSVTSKKKDDREASGLAKGFLVQFEDKGTFIVGLNGFDNEQKAELLNNKQNYIGKHFTYTAMVPVKDFPRHAFFKHFRDEK